MKGIEKAGMKELSLNKRVRNDKGSMTLEACIVLPLFLCIIISIIFLIKLTYTHELIQHAINETAEEIASTAYIYQVSGLRDLHDTAQNGIGGRTEGLKENVENIFGILKSLGGDDALPLDQFEDAANFIAGGAFNSMKTELLTPFTRLIMEKYIAEGSGVSADDRLRSLNVKEGLQGMDFSQSGFFKDEEENIEIVVSYEVSLPVPIKIFPEFKVVQRAAVKAWMSGDEPPETNNIDSEANDVWSLSNLERGKKIRTIFGANLPFSFPVIAKFDGGRAVMIKSMDLTAKSYHDTFNICKVLDEYIGELAEYNGQETPWGSGKIIIENEEINSKQLLLVIPGNQLPPATQELLDKYVASASSKKIELKIERYGIKKTQEEKGKEDDSNAENPAGMNIE